MLDGIPLDNLTGDALDRMYARAVSRPYDAVFDSPAVPRVGRGGRPLRAVGPFRVPVTGRDRTEAGGGPGIGTRGRLRSQADCAVP